jgi:hypothetical protein
VARPSAVSPIDYSRAWLAQLCFALPDNKGDIQVLDDSERLRLALDQLDKQPNRELHRVGVVYVGFGQAEQNDILANTSASCSRLYAKFLRCLGWEVDLATHKGFDGGLDRRTTGSHSLYFADARLELMFHVVTMMPSAGDDVMQRIKKMHVANDYVHVVWSEDAREYNPTTITGHFNHVHIVIYPLLLLNSASQLRLLSASSIATAPADSSADAARLFRIQIFTKPGVPAFGPLQDGMIVGFPELGCLVRLTAVAASQALRRSSRFSSVTYVPSAASRLKAMIDISRRHSSDLVKGQFYSQFFPGVGDGLEDASNASNARAR